MEGALRPILLILCLLAPAAASAQQSYQSALPLDAAERRALEARLSTILDYARPDEVSRFRLPSGRSVAVRAYRPTVDQARGGPCRGYRIDLEGGGRFMAVDGFRCRQPQGGAWTIVEPEIVLAQSGDPAHEEAPAAAPGRTGGADDFAQGVRSSLERNEPLYPADPAVTYGVDGVPIGEEVASEPPPVPRPAPREEIAAARSAPSAAQAGSAAEPPVNAREEMNARIERAQQLERQVGSAVRGESATDAAPEEQSTTAAPVAESAGPAAQSEPPAGESEIARPVPAPSAEAGEPDRLAALEPDADEPDATEADAAPPPAPPARGPARVVTTRNDEEAAGADEAQVGYASDERIVNALQDLNYLDLAAEPTPEAVGQAVDEFAADERVALPMSNEALLARLDDALDRSESLPPCAADADPGSLCLEP